MHVPKRKSTRASRESTEPVATGPGLVEYFSPRTGAPLWQDAGELVSAAGDRIPIVRGIPRFVPSDDYAEAFGLQWNLHAETQLDSRTGASLSQVRLERCAGMPLERFAGLRVLEAGCGAGRFTELMVRAGAWVHAVDLSAAVEANRRNIGARDNYTIAQADIRALPFAPGSFDVVLCLGVLQHTPSPEQSIAALWRMLRPGGRLVIDHYGWADWSRLTKLAPLYRMVLKRMTPERAKRATDAMVRIFFPLHWAFRRFRPLQIVLSRVSPCLSYCHIYPQLTRRQHEDWCRLDTYDELTDHYKRLRTLGSIRRTLESLGATDIRCSQSAGVVEARCRKPGRS